MPPVAADGTDGDIGDVVPGDDLIDVRVTLKDGENVVAFEEREHFVGIGHTESVVGGGLGRRRRKPRTP